MGVINLELKPIFKKKKKRIYAYTKQSNVGVRPIDIVCNGHDNALEKIEH